MSTFGSNLIRKLPSGLNGFPANHGTTSSTATHIAVATGYGQGFWFSLARRSGGLIKPVCPTSTVEAEIAGFFDTKDSLASQVASRAIQFRGTGVEKAVPAQLGIA
jgi:hypothetical protein